MAFVPFSFRTVTFFVLRADLAIANATKERIEKVSVGGFTMYSKQRGR